MRNYHKWRVSTHALLHALQQWVVITGMATTPTPVNLLAPTPDEAAALEAWHVRSWALYIKIMYQCDTSARAMISNLEYPRLIWEMLKQWYSTRQHGLQSVLSQAQSAEVGQ